MTKNIAEIVTLLHLERTDGLEESSTFSVSLEGTGAITKATVT